MISLTNDIFLIFYTEMAIVLLTVPLLVKEVTVLRNVISHQATLSLLGLLTGVWLMNISRVLGIYLDSLIIRTYMSALFGLVGILSFLNWGGIVINMRDKYRYLSFGILILGMSSFLLFRELKWQIFELISIIIMVVFLSGFLINILIFVFKTSPYIRARQKLFTLSVSFVLLALFEGIAVYNLGIQNYIMASYVFLVEIVFRMGITLSILMPTKLVSVLNIIIK